MDMVKIVHNDIEKISDRVAWLSPKWVLRFNVELFYKRNSKNSEEKIRDNFHREFGYIYNDKFGVKITRDFNYYFTIETVKRGDDGFKTSVSINQNSFYFLKFKLHNAIESWFQNDTVFSRKNGRLFIPTAQDPIAIQVDYGNTIELVPHVGQENGMEVIGVLWFINSNDPAFFMSVNNLLGFTDMLDHFNMYEAATIAMAYLGRPEYGTNYMDTGMNTSKSTNQGFFSQVNASTRPSED